MSQSSTFSLENAASVGPPNLFVEIWRSTQANQCTRGLSVEIVRTSGINDSSKEIANDICDQDPISALAQDIPQRSELKDSLAASQRLVST
jgi:hypothetical protein